VNLGKAFPVNLGKAKSRKVLTRPGEVNKVQQGVVSPPVLELARFHHMTDRA